MNLALHNSIRLEFAPGLRTSAGLPRFFAILTATAGSESLKMVGTALEGATIRAKLGASPL